ncbi:MAG: hypothetical protein WDN45_14365 [Caulobacteraceae bacterium]
MRIPLLAVAFALLATTVLASPAVVVVKDKGVKTTCAEEDNVYATITGPVQRFTVTARQPAYGKELKADNYKADFSGCKPACVRRQEGLPVHPAHGGPVRGRQGPHRRRHLRRLLAPRRGRGRGGRQEGPGLPPAAAVHQARRRRAGGPGAARRRRLLAPASPAAAAVRRGGLRLVVPGGAGRGIHPSLCAHPQGDHRPQGPALPSRLCAGRLGQPDRYAHRPRRAAGQGRVRPGHAQFAPSSPCARCTWPRTTPTPPRCTGPTPSASATAPPPSASTRPRATAVSFERSVPSRHNTSAPDILFSDFDG